jgi:ribosomal RNA-processing protein 12
LSQLLYNQPELRPPVLKALKTLVESNAKESQSGLKDQLPKEEVEKNRKFLQTQAESWFAVLFNVFGSVGRENQGMVGDVISSWASVAGREVCYNRDDMLQR